MWRVSARFSVHVLAAEMHTHYRENVAISVEKTPLAATCDEGTFRPTREDEEKKISTHRKEKMVEQFPN